MTSGADPLAHPFLREGAGRWTVLETWRAPSGVLLHAALAEGERALVGLGDVREIRALLGAALPDVPARGLDLATLPRGAVGRGGQSAGLTHVLDWDWLVCERPPAPRVGEEHVAPLTAGDAGEVATLLETAYPADLRPSAERPDLQRWGWRDSDGSLLGTLASRELAPGGPVRLGGIATHPDARRRGIASALTAVATRAALERGAPWVSLAIRADNAAARAVYTGLGFVVGAELETLR